MNLVADGYCAVGKLANSFLGIACLVLGVLMTLRALAKRPLTSHPYQAGTEHTEFSPDQAHNHASAKRRDAFGELDEG